jgi:sugar (pentulose or hexulose) kinase
MAILALDQGTSATKALIVGDDGQVIASASAPLEISHSQFWPGIKKLGKLYLK